MALSGSTVWEVRTDGDDTNGGGFVTGASGTDHSQQAAAQYSVTDAETFGTTNVDSATANFGTDVVGNIVYIQGGSAGLAASRYQIISRTSTTRIVVDRNITIGTGATLKIGGALASPGLITNVAPCPAAAGNKVWIKSGTYTLNTTTGNSNGVVSYPVRMIVEGYQTTRGDKGARPVLSSSSLSGVTLFTAQADGSHVYGIELDGNSETGVAGFLLGGVNICSCRVLDCPGAPITCDQDSTIINCYIFGSGAIALGAGGLYACVIANGTGVGVTLGRNGRCYNCIAVDNTSDGFDLAASDGAVCLNCVSYSNGGDGFNNNGDGQVVINCIAEANTGYGFDSGTSSFGSVRFNCAAYNNTAGNINNALAPVQESGGVTGTGSFFTNAATGDFSLNNTAGAGADLREAAYPSAFPT